MNSLRLPILLTSSLTLATGALFAAPSASITETPAVLPRPAKLALAADSTGFALTGPLKVKSSGATDSAVAALRAGLPAGIVVATEAADSLVISLNPALGAEAYQLKVTPTSITLVAGDAAGAFYGAQTLIQSMVKDAAGVAAIPAMTVEDTPRFKWRGLMIDSSRHFLKPEQMRRVIDLMAMHKLNTLHWHLTDDQGWRIEIKKYPKLTAIGAVRAESPEIGDRNKGDGHPYGPFFYTQEQVKELVAYAKTRHVTIVPEIEMPGHAQAAIAAYPELGNEDAPGFTTAAYTRWGVNPNVFAPKETTFKFIDEVIGEVASLFPDSPYIHIGGDECPKDQWEKSPFAKKVMKAHKLKNTHELQSWFIRRAEKSINARGKKLIGWDEIQEGGLSPTATMMVWREWKWAKHAIDNGNDVVMTPTTHCYFDYGQGGEPNAKAFEFIAGKLTLEHVYSLEPIPQGIKPGREKHVLGVQGNLWSEYIVNMAKWEYMAFPRAIALAEVGWSPKSGKDFKNFESRLARHESRLDALKVNYRKSNGAPAQPDRRIDRE